MKILSIDSTAKVASAALLSDATLLAETTVRIGRSHSETLLPMIEGLLAMTGIRPEEIDLFACAAGPGSFTGVRIGVATVKGLAFGRGVPCAAVSSLEALAENLVPLPGILCPVMDARREQVYQATFRYEEGKLLRLCPDRAIAIRELSEELRAAYPGEAIRLVGDGCAVAAAGLREAGLDPLLPPEGLAVQSAAAVGRCAARMAAAGQTVTDAALAPVYLREPQAERERKERLKQRDCETSKN